MPYRLTLRDSYASHKRDTEIIIVSDSIYDKIIRDFDFDFKSLETVTLCHPYMLNAARISDDTVTKLCEKYNISTIT